MPIKAKLVLGFYEDCDEDDNKYLNVEFLNKFDINIYGTYIENNRADIIYGIPVSLKQINTKTFNTEQSKIDKFINHMKDKYNMVYRSPFLTSVIDYYNSDVLIKDNTEVNLDYTYDPFNGLEVKKYIIYGTMYFKGDIHEDSSMVEDIIKYETFKYGYKFKWFQLDNDSDHNSYYMDMYILITGDIEEWIEKIKQSTEQYVWYKDLKYMKR